jgi:transglutaminase-like putative cysteine protease
VKAGAIAAPAGAQRDLSRIGWLDYLLMTIGSCLAGYSGGMAINEPGISWFVVQWTLAGGLFSYLMRRALIQAPAIKIDGLFYGIVVVATFIFRSRLQTVMPAGGFPFELIAAGWLCWMIILGSFFTWQDSTLLFQAVPSIAMFGLVGCYDTFRGVIFLFFAFLMCLATLFARAHYRQMLRQAAHSGYFTRGLAPGTPIPEVETTPGLAQKMQDGPWRWVAGPEWALGSALVVVLVSLLGAPVIRQSTQGVSGFVRIPPAPVRRQFQQATTSLMASTFGQARIGMGQNRVTHAPVLEATLPGLRYLRSNTYDSYANRSWSFRGGLRPDEGRFTSANTAAYEELVQGGGEIERSEFTIALKQPLRSLPHPGVVTDWPDPRALGPEMPDGSFSISSGSVPEFKGTFSEPASIGRDLQAQTELSPIYRFMLNLDGVPSSVIRKGREVAGEGNDFQRAERIRRYIATTVRYNLNVGACPAGKDPIEYTLFERPEAYCDIYASAMTVMARAAGIPARYVTGYLPSPESQDQRNRYVVLESDAHAWSELFFEGVGWVVFDATSGAESVPGGERGAATDNVPWYQKAWVRTAIDGLMVVLSGIAVIFALRAVAAMKKVRTPRGDLERAYLTYSRSLEQAARKRRDLSRTADEWFADAAPHLGPTKETAESLNRRFVHALYAPGDPSEEDLTRLREDVRRWQRELAQATKGKR